MDARKIVDGKVGDAYNVAVDFKGKKANAVGIPLDTPRGKAYPVPDGIGPPNTTVYVREDYRKTDKNAPLFSEKKN